MPAFLIRMSGYVTTWLTQLIKAYTLMAIRPSRMLYRTKPKDV